MQRWPVGQVEVVRIVDEELTLPPSALARRPDGTVVDTVPGWAIPRFAPTTEQVALAFSALAVRAEDGTRIVVDPWLVNDAVRTRPDATERVDRLLGELAAADFGADEIDVVVLTHLDGIGWSTRPDGAAGWRPTFPRARYLLTGDELDAWRSGVIPGHEGLQVLIDAGVLDTVDPPVSVAPGVSLEPAPGHSPGHTAVRIESGGRLALYAGHLFLTPLQVADPTLANDADRQTASAVRHAILDELAARQGLLLTTLVGGPGGGIVRESWDGAGWSLEPV